MIRMCDYCNNRPPMIGCRDCEQPAACFLCTINKPTGGFCREHLLRFTKLHWDNHKPEESDDEKGEKIWAGPHSDGSILG